MMMFAKLKEHSQLVKGGAWLAVEKIFLAIKGLILSLLFANFVSQETFGSYQFLLSILGILSVFSIPSMGTAMVRAVANKREGSYVWGLHTMIKWSLIGSLVLCGLAIYDYFKRGTGLTASLVILALIYPAYAVMSTWRYYLLGKEAYKKIVQISFVIETISFVFTAGAVLFSPTLVSILLTSIVLTLILSSFYIYILYRRHFLSEHAEEDIRYGKKLSFSYAVQTIVGYVDKVLIGYFLNLSDVALYSIALMAPEQVRNGLSTFSTLLLPSFSKIHDSRTYRKKILSGISSLMLALALFIGAYYLFAPILFQVLFPKYENAVWLSQILMLGLVLSPLTILDAFFRGQGKEKIITNITLTTSIGGLIIMLVLIPYFGLWGAVWSRIIAASLNALVLFGTFFFQRRSLK